MVSESNACQSGAQDDFSARLASLKTQLESESDLDPAKKQQVVSLLDAADATLTAIQDLQQRIAENRDQIDSVEQDAQRTIEAIQLLKQLEPLAVDETIPLTELEKETAKVRKSSDELKTELLAIESKINNRIARKSELNSQSETADQRIAEFSSALQTLPELDQSLLAEATKLDVGVQLARAQNLKATTETELQRMDAEERINLLRSQRDLLATELARQQDYLSKLDETLARKRNESAEKKTEDAKQKQLDAKSEYPLLSASFGINTKLADRLVEVVSQATEAKNQSDVFKTDLEQLNILFRETKTRVESLGSSGSIGLSGSAGAMLRKRKADLPDAHSLLVDANQVKARIDELQFEIFDVDQQLAELSVETIRSEIHQAEGKDLTASQLADLDDPVEEIIKARKETLEALSTSMSRLFESLFLQQTYDQLIRELAGQFREYINERILWIRSNNMLFSELEIDENDISVFNLATWTDALRSSWLEILKSPFAFCLWLSAILLLFLGKPPLRTEVDRMGEIAARGSCDTFWPTGRATFLTLLIGLIGPLIPLGLGIVLGISPATSNILFNNLGSALLATAVFAIPFEVLRRMCRPNGLAIMHFDWSKQAATVIRANLTWFTFPASVIVFFVTLLFNIDSTHRVDLVERALFIAGLIGVEVLVYRVFNPSTGFCSRYLAASQRSWAHQTSALWFGIILAIPLLLAALTFFGYYYTALNLARCAFWTFVFAVIAEITRALIKRFILVRRRHAHIQAARKKREAQLEARREEQRRKVEAQKAAVAVEGGSPGLSDAQTVASAGVANPDLLADIEPELDIDEHALQATKLVNMAMIFVWAVALWMIWIDVLPAMKALDSFTVWSTGNSEIASAADNESATPAVESDIALLRSGIGTADDAGQIADGTANRSRVTVRDVLIFLLIGMVTLVSARNLPNALEMLFLEQLPVDRSARYATKALFSYFVMMVGVIFAFRALSISWTNVQWLVTALTFGLAFGLQEIFANFVAGIILMFERPMRIGDWITVDNFTGMVTRIRTRATTIRNWDRKEYIIPNKDLITGRLVNWTLSDAINQIVIDVGVAYGSDLEQAKAILFDVCLSHPQIVKEPATYVAFDKFGDSALNLTIRTFISEIDRRLQVIDELHMSIDKRFREAGIEVSFPQRDLHIRSIDPSVTRSFVVAKKEPKQRPSRA